MTARLSVPALSELAGILIVALPLLRAIAAEVVGVGLLLPPLTATVTVSGCVVVMLDADGVTVTVGVVLAGVVTVTVADPEALL